MAEHWLTRFARGEAINHKDFLADHAKDRASGRNLMAWICTRALTEAIRRREDEWSECNAWPKYSVAASLLEVQRPATPEVEE